MRRLFIALFVVFVTTACAGATRPRPIPTPLPTPTSKPIEPVTLKGRGDSVVEVGHLQQYTKARIVCTAAQGHFLVVPYDHNNDRLVSLVNEIAPYDGTVKWDQRAASLEIKADGEWTITLSQ